MMFKPYRLWALSAATFLGGANLEAPRFSLLYQFAGGVDGDNVSSGLTPERHALYGATQSGGEGDCDCGEVFRLTPPTRRGMAWTKTTIFSFTGGAGGKYPREVIVDRDGAIYGTTVDGGVGFGIVFRLTPPASPAGKWTETVLHSFGSNQRDGIYPIGPIIAGPSGALYGTAEFGGRYDKGIVYSLTPPVHGGTEWTETVLHEFAGGSDGAEPFGGVTADQEGSLYGTTEYGGIDRNGTVFQLKRQADSKEWRETIIYRFAGGSDGSEPIGGLTADAAGTLYGTTTAGGGASCFRVRGCGTIFRLKPDGAGGWDETTLYRFVRHHGSFSNQDLVQDDNGTLYGTTEVGPGPGCGGQGCGEVFSLAPPLPFEASWRETTLHAFTGGSDGGFPNALFLEKRTGVLYGTARLYGLSGCVGFGYGCGTAFMIQLRK